MEKNTSIQVLGVSIDLFVGEWCATSSDGCYFAFGETPMLAYMGLIKRVDETIDVLATEIVESQLRDVRAKREFVDGES